MISHRQDVCHHANYLRISVTDKDCVGTFDVGGCMIDLRKLMDGEKVTYIAHSRSIPSRRPNAKTVLSD